MGSSAINLSGPLGPAQFRNKLINGDFNLWQRGSSITTGPAAGAVGTVTTNRSYNADRWNLHARLGRGVSGGAVPGDGNAYASVPRCTICRKGFTFGYPQLSDVSPSEYYTRVTIGAADGTNTNGVTGASMDLGNGIIEFSQLTDDNIHEFSNKTCHLSFLAKSYGDVINPTIGTNLSFDPDFSRGVNHHTVPDTTGTTASFYHPVSLSRKRIKIVGDDVTVTPSWQKYKQKFKLPDFTGCTLGTLPVIETSLILAAGASAPDELSGNISYTDLLALNGITGAIDFAQIQLEIGDDVSDFEKRKSQVELELCQRYYEKTYNVDTDLGTDTGYGGGIRGATDPSINPTNHQPTQFEVRKRTAPSVTLYSKDGGAGQVYVVHAQTHNATSQNATAGGISESGIARIDMDDDNDLGDYSRGDTLIVFHYTADAEIG